MISAKCGVNKTTRAAESVAVSRGMAFVSGRIRRHLSSRTTARAREGGFAWAHAAHSPVNADSAQVEDAGGAHHHIKRDKDVTVEPAEKPGAADHLHRTDRDINSAHVSSPLPP